MRHTKCLVALIATLLGSGFATVTSYTPGVDLDTAGSSRTDFIAIGGAGSLSGYIAPHATTTSLNIILTQTGTSAAVNSAGPGTSTLPGTLTSLTLSGFAAGIDTVFGTGAGLQLPTPHAGCAVVFSLNSSPSGLCQWFQSSIPATCNINIYPSTCDPMFSGGILDVSSLSIITGIGLSMPTSASLSGGVVNASIVRRGGMSTYPALTLTGNTVFSANISHLSLTGAHTATFNAPSAIYGIDSSVTGVTIGSGVTLSLYNLAGSSVPATTFAATTSTLSVKGGAI